MAVATGTAPGVLAEPPPAYWSLTPGLIKESTEGIGLAGYAEKLAWVFHQKGLDKSTANGNHLGLVVADRSAGMFLVRSLKRAEYSECQKASAPIARATRSQPFRQIQH